MCKLYNIHWTICNHTTSAIKSLCKHARSVSDHHCPGPKDTKPTALTTNRWCEACTKALDEAAKAAYLASSASGYRIQLIDAKSAALAWVKHHFPILNTLEQQLAAEFSVFKLHTAILHQIQSSVTQTFDAKTLQTASAQAAPKIAWEATQKGYDIRGILGGPGHPIFDERMKVINEQVKAAVIAHKFTAGAYVFFRGDGAMHALMHATIRVVLEHGLGIGGYAAQIAAAYAVYARQEGVVYNEGAGVTGARLLDSAARGAGFRDAAEMLWREAAQARNMMQ